MLKYAIVFAIVSLIAGALGFGGVAAGAAGIAKVLFGLFLILAVVSMFVGVTNVSLPAVLSGDPEAWHILTVSRLPRTAAVLLSVVLIDRVARRILQVQLRT